MGFGSLFMMKIAKEVLTDLTEHLQALQAINLNTTATNQNNETVAPDIGFNFQVLNYDTQDKGIGDNVIVNHPGNNANNRADTSGIGFPSQFPENNTPGNTVGMVDPVLNLNNQLATSGDWFNFQLPGFNFQDTGYFYPDLSANPPGHLVAIHSGNILANLDLQGDGTTAIAPGNSVAIHFSNGPTSSNPHDGGAEISAAIHDKNALTNPNLQGDENTDFGQTSGMDVDADLSIALPNDANLQPRRNVASDNNGQGYTQEVYRDTLRALLRAQGIHAP